MHSDSKLAEKARNNSLLKIKQKQKNNCFFCKEPSLRRGSQSDRGRKSCGMTVEGRYDAPEEVARLRKKKR